MLAFAAQCPARCPIVGCVRRSGCLPQRQAACLLRACSKSPHRVPCFAKAVAARRKAQSTEQKRTRCPASYLQHGRCCLCRASLEARQPMTILFVAPLAKTGSTGCGVRRDPDHLLRLRTHATGSWDGAWLGRFVDQGMKGVACSRCAHCASQMPGHLPQACPGPPEMACKSDTNKKMGLPGLSQQPRCIRCVACALRAHARKLVQNSTSASHWSVRYLV